MPPKNIIQIIYTTIKPNLNYLFHCEWKPAAESESESYDENVKASFRDNCLGVPGVLFTPCECPGVLFFFTCSFIPDAQFSYNQKISIR